MKKMMTFLLMAILLQSACTAPTATNTLTQAVATSTAAVDAAEPVGVDPTSTAVAASEGPAVLAVSEPTAAPPAVDSAGLDTEANAAADPSALDKTLDAVGTGELSAAEIQGLLYMREEEKLARDVYLTLYEKWGLGVFQNIASSEVTHMEAIKTLIDRYNLPDPVEGKGVGVFVDETLQTLYDQLVAQGSGSLADALRVGAAIEEIDILDLEAYLAQTTRTDIQRVYQSLSKGSRNHLRAFVRTLQRQSGEIYDPQYLDQAAYDRIVGTESERGRGNGRGG